MIRARRKFAHKMLRFRHVALRPIFSILSFSLTLSGATSIQQALNERFLDYTQNACKINPWIAVKADKAIKYKDGDAAPPPDVVPTAFRQPWDVMKPIAVQLRDITIAGVTEKIYTEAEKNDLSKFLKNDSWVVLDNGSPIPNVSQANANHSIAYYSHSCSYLLQAGMNARTGYTLPFAAIQASFQAAANGETKGNLVVVGGTFPSRLAVLLTDTPGNKLFAAASLWDWYTRLHGTLPVGQLYYLSSVQGFADSAFLGAKAQISTTLNAKGNLGFVFVSVDANAQAAVSTQEEVYSQSFTFTLLPPNPSEFKPLPDLKALDEIFAASTATRPANSAGPAKFDVNYRFTASEQSDGLPPKVCQRKWEFVADSASQAQVGAVTASVAGDPSAPACVFSLQASLPNAAVFAGSSAKLKGLLRTTDQQSQNKLSIPISDIDISLPDIPSPGQISVSPIPSVDPTGWPRTDSAHLLQYQISIPFDDHANVLDWSQPFRAGKPTLSCEGRTPLGTASWVSDTIVPNQTTKTIDLQLGYIYFVSREALDVYSKDWKNASPCTVTMSLNASRSGTAAPFTFAIDTSKTGNSGLFFPKVLSSPQIKVIAADGSALSGDSGTPLQLPDAFAGVPYTGSGSALKLTVSGGLGPYNWAWADNMPPGLDPLKVTDGYGALVPISGTPAVTQTYSFSVQVTDKAGQVATQPVVLTVKPALTITTSQLDSGKVGTTYKTSLTASGGVPGYHWKLVLGPPTPQVSVTDDGTVSFTPTAAGVVTFVVEAADSAKQPHKVRGSFDVTVSQ